MTANATSLPRFAAPFTPGPRALGGVRAILAPQVHLGLAAIGALDAEQELQPGGSA